MSKARDVSERRERLAKARKALADACHIVWYHKTIHHDGCTCQPHFWSIPVDAARDVDVIISDALDDLEVLLAKEAEAERQGADQLHEWQERR